MNNSNEYYYTRCGTLIGFNPWVLNQPIYVQCEELELTSPQLHSDVVEGVSVPVPHPVWIS